MQENAEATTNERQYLADESPSSDQPLLEAVLHRPVGDMAAGTSGSKKSSDRGLLDRFLNSESPEKALEIWLGKDAIRNRGGVLWSDVARQLQRDIGRIDQLLSDQLTVILHHPAFQKLEASWRGLEYLVNVKDGFGDAPIKIRVLNVRFGELFKDFDNAVEFDQSHLFKKVYEQEFGSPGGEPFGALIADYEIHPRPSREHPYDDMAMLRSLSKVAAAAFCPIVLNASPAMFSLDRFDQMQATADYEKIHNDLSFLSWQSFRETEDSRFVGLAMPRMLLRRPYVHRDALECDFPFVEQVGQRDECLWGGAAFAMGEVLMRSFADNRWLADIRGAQRGGERGGIVRGVPAAEFQTEGRNLAERPITETQLSDSLERQMVDLGFLPLCACKDMPIAAFFSCSSAQKPRAYSDAAADANARISSMLNYMFCASRFAHYIKVIGRDKIGSFLEASELQRYLENWIHGYVTPDSEASDRVKAQYPLREAELHLAPLRGKPGTYECVFQLSPHYELDDMQASIKLRTELIRRA